MKIRTDMFRLILTETCNAKCKYCLASNTPKDGQNQSFEAVDIAARKAKQNGAKEVAISGGEPLLDKDILAKIGIVKRYFKIINLQTNAILLNKPQDFKKAGVKNVLVNLPSFEEDIYEKLVGLRKLNQVIRNIKKALKVGLNVRICSVLVKNYTDDYAHIMCMIDFSRQLGVNEITFIQLIPVNGFAKKYRAGLGKLRRLFSRLDKIESKKYNSADIYKFLGMKIALSSCPVEKNYDSFRTGWTKEYVLTEDSRLVTDYFHQEKTTLEVLK